MHRILRSWRWKSNSAPSASRASRQRYARSSLSTNKKLFAIFIVKNVMFFAIWSNQLLQCTCIFHIHLAIFFAGHWPKDHCGFMYSSFLFCRSGKLGDWIAQLGTFEGSATPWSKKSPRWLAAKVGVCGGWCQQWGIDLISSSAFGRRQY